MSDADLTLHEAAELLGVHYMTAYRYVRLGVLPAVKVGGSWHVAAADLHTFKAGASAVPTAGDTPTRRRAPWASRLEARLVAGDGRGAWGVVEAALAAGAELDEIYLDVISPAMRNIGERWESGELDIAVEHRASGIALRLIGRLGPRFARRGRTRGTVLLGTPQGERHSLPVAMLADLLRGDGWEVSDIGADLPVESFVRAAVDAHDLVAVGVSVTSADNLPAAAEVLNALRAAVGDVYVAVGGAAVVDEAHAVALGAQGWASSAQEFNAQLQGRSSSGARTG
ncbi:MAG: cobalamin B12-binding domain-containing protein [Actinobacteria bacterium]|nr:cobalamin B12-binding domain-containing protein [Actinomycetota bacterium]